jgi:P-type Cu2+ transporter
MTSAAVLRASVLAAERSACFHCGLPVAEAGRYTAVVDGTVREMCCPGCQAVAETIAGAGLASYYRSRERLPPRESGTEVRPPTARAMLEVYDRPELQRGFVTEHADGTREAVLILEDIHCAACVWLNEQHLARQPGVTSVDINYVSRRARVRWNPDAARLSQLLAAVEAIGYHAWPDDDANRARVERSERRQALWRLAVAGLAMMQVMMYAYPAYVAGAGDLPLDLERLMRYASLVLTLPVVLFSAAPFFRGAVRDLRMARLGMDVPVALGVAAGFVGSCWSTFTDGPAVYFDSVTMFVFLLLLGRFLERTARERAYESVRRLAHAIPAMATRIADDGATHEIVPAAMLLPGQVVLVPPGEAFPADGVVVTGITQVDEALLTGESRPIAKRTADEVTGGAINLTAPVTVRVTGVGNDTRLAAIVRLMEQAQAQRPALTAAADRVAFWFVLAILAIAAAAAAAWWWIDAARALPIAVAVLVVTCPCALSLATPAALTVAIGTLARRGVVVARGSAIDALARVTCVVIDKTGTLTEGRPTVVETRALGSLDAEACRRLASALEHGSNHPIALALRSGTVGEDEAIDPVHAPGGGIEGSVGGRRLRIGSRRFVEAWLGEGVLPREADSRTTEVWLAAPEGPLAVFKLGDALRPDAAALVARLRAAGCEIVLASGDESGPVTDVARRLHIGIWHAELSPEDKRALVERLQRAGARVAMIGDGINDAPVLAQSDCAVAMGSGAALAHSAADVVITARRLAVIADALQFARRTLAVVRSNLAWAFAYNVIAIPLTVLGWVPPWAAALGMSASSLLVVVNALRLRNPRGARGEAARVGGMAIAGSR